MNRRCGPLGTVKNRNWPVAALLALAGWMSLAVDADAQQIIVQGGDPLVQVTDWDIDADAKTVDLASRHHALSDAQKVDVTAKALFVRAVLAEQAKSAGLDKTPEAQTRLKLAQQRVLMELMLEQLEQKHAPSKEELLKYAEAEYKSNPQRFMVPAETKASHILIFSGSDEAEQRIRAVYRQLQEGGDFGELAFKHSEDAQTAPLYGSLGYFDPTKMVLEFQGALKALQKNGQYSEPFKTRYGWHIVRLDDRREAGKLSFDEVREVLMEQGRKAAMDGLRDDQVEKSVAQIKVDEKALEAFAAKHKKLADEARKKY